MTRALWSTRVKSKSTSCSLQRSEWHLRRRCTKFTIFAYLLPRFGDFISPLTQTNLVTFYSVGKTHSGPAVSHLRKKPCEALPEQKKVSNFTGSLKGFCPAKIGGFFFYKDPSISSVKPLFKKFPIFDQLQSGVTWPRNSM